MFLIEKIRDYHESFYLSSCEQEPMQTELDKRVSRIAAYIAHLREDPELDWYLKTINANIKNDLEEAMKPYMEIHATPNELVDYFRGVERADGGGYYGYYGLQGYRCIDNVELGQKRILLKRRYLAKDPNDWYITHRFMLETGF